MIKLLFSFLRSSVGWGLRLLLLHSSKNCLNFLMYNLIALKFGTNKEQIKVNSSTEFDMNLIGIQCVRSDDSCKK